MAIFLDTNVLPLRGNAFSFVFDVVRALVRQRGQSLFLPTIAFEEAAAIRTRELEAKVRDVQRAIAAAQREGLPFAQLDLPSVEPLVATWKAELTRHVQMVPLPTGTAEEALLREVSRARPTREGKGARDAAIWLTVVHAHQDLGEISYFVSQNTKDFGDSQDQDSFHPDLQIELQTTKHALKYCSSLAKLLDEIGDEVESPSLDELRSSNLVIGAIVNAFAERERLRDLSGNGFYVASEVEINELEMPKCMAYRVEEQRVAVALCSCIVRFLRGELLRFKTGGFAQNVMPVQVRATFELWLALSNNEPPEIHNAEIASFESQEGYLFGEVS